MGPCLFECQLPQLTHQCRFRSPTNLRDLFYVSMLLHRRLRFPPFPIHPDLLPQPRLLRQQHYGPSSSLGYQSRSQICCLEVYYPIRETTLVGRATHLYMSFIPTPKTRAVVDPRHRPCGGGKRSFPRNLFGSLTILLHPSLLQINP